LKRPEQEPGKSAGDLSPEVVERIATTLGVLKTDVVEMNQRMS
jgi:hypothetical protein